MNFAMEFLFRRGIPFVLIQQVATGIFDGYFLLFFPIFTCCQVLQVVFNYQFYLLYQNNQVVL